VINTEQIEEIMNFKSDENYFLGNIPEWINLKIEELSARQINITGDIFSLLGVLNDTLILDSYEENVVRLVQKDIIFMLRQVIQLNRFVKEIT
jgi:hypothetical protein